MNIWIFFLGESFHCFQTILIGACDTHTQTHTHTLLNIRNPASFDEENIFLYKDDTTSICLIKCVKILPRAF